MSTEMARLDARKGLGQGLVLQIPSGRFARQFHIRVAAVKALPATGFQSLSWPVGETVNRDRRSPASIDVTDARSPDCPHSQKTVIF